MKKEFGKLLDSRAITVEAAIVTPHAAIGALLAAEIGQLHDGADEDFSVEPCSGGRCRAFVQSGLHRAIRRQV
jgi:hypothetical protein